MWCPLTRGRHRQVTGGRQSGFPEGPFRAAPERQRGFLRGNRSSGGAGVAKRSRMPHRGCHRRRQGVDSRDFRKGPSGPHRSDSEVSGRKQSSAGAGVAKRSRMPHRGCHRQVTGGRQSGFPEGPFRAAPERQRGFRKETEQRRCRRSEAEPHAPPGPSPSGDWG